MMLCLTEPTFQSCMPGKLDSVVPYEFLMPCHDGLLKFGGHLAQSFLAVRFGSSSLVLFRRYRSERTGHTPVAFYLHGSCRPLLSENLRLLQDRLYGRVLQVGRVSVLPQYSLHENSHTSPRGLPVLPVHGGVLLEMR